MRKILAVVLASALAMFALALRPDLADLPSSGRYHYYFVWTPFGPKELDFWHMAVLSWGPMIILLVLSVLVFSLGFRRGRDRD